MTTIPQVARPQKRQGPAADSGLAAGAGKVPASGLAELVAQVLAVLEVLPSGVIAVIRAQYGQGDQPVLAVVEVWAVSVADGPVADSRARHVHERRVGDLPAAVGSRLGLVEQALDQAGVCYPRADLGLRARWRRLTVVGEQVPGYELVVSSPGRRGGQRPAGSRSQGLGRG